MTEKIFDTLWQIKKDGYAEATINGTSRTLRMMAKAIDLDDHEAVKEYIASKHCKNSFRHYFGTMTYHKNKDIIYTRKKMGHISIKNALIYTHVINFKEADAVTRLRQKNTASSFGLAEAY